MNPILLLAATVAIAESHDRAVRTARGEERPHTPGEPDVLIIDGCQEESALLNPPFNRKARRCNYLGFEKPHRSYACPSCNAKADTPKRCRKCNVKMRRVR